MSACHDKGLVHRSVWSARWRPREWLSKCGASAVLGRLDELTLWRVALDDAAIADLAATGVPANPTGLIARWELDEGTGQTAADSATGASHPGTLGAGAGCRHLRSGLGVRREDIAQH